MRATKLIQENSFLVLGVSLSLPIAIQSKIIFLFILAQIIIALIEQRRISRKGIALPVLYILLFLTSLFSIIYSENLEFGLSKITTQLSLLFIPTVFIILGIERVRALSTNFFRGVLVGNLFLVLYITFGLLYAILFSKIDIVSSQSIRMLEGLLNGYNHRTYIAIALVAGYISLNSIWDTRDLRYKSVIKTLYATLLWSIIFLLGVRSILLIYSIILFFQIITSLDLRKAIFASVLFIVSIFLLLSIHPRLSKYITRESDSISEVMKSNVRYELWTAAWELIEKNPLFGYGLGDGKVKLVESTSHVEKISYLQFNPNAHNQFIQGWLDSGILNPLIILGILLIYIHINRSAPNLMRFGLPLLFLFAMFFEVILYRLSGVILFASMCLILPPRTNLTMPNYRIFRAIVLIASFALVTFVILQKTTITFDPAEPTTYMSLDHSEVLFQDLPGTIPVDIPPGTKGCILNNSSFDKRIKGNLYAQSIIDEANVKNGDSIILTLYCYISENFNGDEVRISGREQILEPNDRYANLRFREQWQFLSINTTSKKGRALYVITVGKHNTTDQDSIFGEVIFANPQMTIINRKTTQ